MSDSDPNQLRLDVEIDQGESGAIESPPERSDYYRKSNGDLVSDKEIDHYANTRGCSMFEAFLRYGVTPEDRIVETDDSTKKPNQKRGNLPVVTNIGERAISLMAAAYKYRQSVCDNTRMYDLMRSGADSAEIDQASIDEMKHRYEGDAAFSEFWPANDLKKAGANLIDVRAETKDQREKFYDLSTNPRRCAELLVLANILEGQKNPKK